jgi:hypothetical protein
MLTGTPTSRLLSAAKPTIVVYDLQHEIYAIGGGGTIELGKISSRCFPASER